MACLRVATVSSLTEGLAGQAHRLVGQGLLEPERVVLGVVERDAAVERDHACAPSTSSRQRQ
jgi:hypothetical protein